MKIKLSTAIAVSTLLAALLSLIVSLSTPLKLWRLMQVTSAIALAASLWEAAEVSQENRSKHTLEEDFRNG